MKKTKILALVGKGGVGKTSICSAFVRILSEKCPQARILAIDADPAVGLATALGVEVRETLDDLRLEIIEKAAQGAGKEAIELLGEVRYRIFDALIEKDGFFADLVSRQRLDMPEKPGKIRIPDMGEECDPVTVMPHHLDTNHHVNNAQYVEMARECLPEDFRIFRICAEYRKAAKLGDVIFPLAAKTGDGYVVSLKSEAGEAYANIMLTGH